LRLGRCFIAVAAPPRIARTHLAEFGAPGGATNAAKKRLSGMGPREEDNGMLLLVAITLICAMIAVLPGVLEPPSSVAASRPPPTYLASQDPVRIVGPPFIPNTNPRER